MKELKKLFDLPEDASGESADTAVLSAPLEKTVSFGGGTSGGPSAIIEASCQVELFDMELGVEPDFAKRFTTLPQLDFSGLTVERSMEIIRDEARAQLDAGRMVIGLGGEHSITPPLAEAAREKNGAAAAIVFDAHSDLRNEYEGSANSHACASRRLIDLGYDVYIFGVRSMCSEESDFIKSSDRVRVFSAEDCRGKNFDDDFSALIDRIKSPIYLSFDIDGLDPSVAPGTGTPEPGGLGWRQTCSMLKGILSAHRLAGLDICEVSPMPGSYLTEFTAAKLLYKILVYQALLGPKVH